MTADEVIDELNKEPFQPLRLHMVSGKAFDVLAANVAHPLINSLLILRNPVLGTNRAEGYDVISYDNIERIEQLHIGKQSKRRRSA
jgi:hypothetical protein